MEQPDSKWNWNWNEKLYYSIDEQHIVVMRFMHASLIRFLLDSNQSSRILTLEADNDTYEDGNLEIWKA